MRRFLSKLFRDLRTSSSARPSRAKTRKAISLHVEELDARVLPSLTPIGIVMTSGSGQGTQAGTNFANSLVAKVENPFDGAPVSGVSVTFTAPASGASGSFNNGSTTISGTTNSTGQARVSFTANADYGSYSVTAQISGTTNSISFALNNNEGDAVLTVQQVKSLYGFNSVPNFTVGNNSYVPNGKGQTIAILDPNGDPNIVADLSTFSSNNGLLQCDGKNGDPTFTEINDTGSTVAPTANPTMEIDQDVEWAHAIAPGANIVLVEIKSFAAADVDQGLASAHSQDASVVSMSFLTDHDPEQTPPAGMTYVSAAGDAAGDTFGSVNGTSTFTSGAGSNDLIVGGTQLSQPGAQLPQNNVAYPGEQVWNQYAIDGTSWTVGEATGNVPYPAGTTYGTYQNFTNASNNTQSVSLPSWQSGAAADVAAQTGLPAPTNRMVPDVSMLATRVQAVDLTDPGNQNQAWGTSLATPMWAGLIAIANQGRQVQGLSPLNSSDDPILPAVYNLPSFDFNHVTSDTQYAYDQQTGLGTPKANLIIPALAAPDGQLPNNGQLTIEGNSPGSDTISVNVENVTIPFVGITLPVVQVQVNNLTNYFLVSEVKSIVVDALGATETVNINATPAGVPLTINLGSGADAVNINNLSGLGGSVTLNNGTGSGTLNINDSSDTTGRTVWMGDGYFVIPGSTAIYWSPTSAATGGVNFVEVEGGSGGNTFDIYNTSNLAYETFLDTGMGNDTVNVFGTQGSLYVYNPGGNDTTTVGGGNLSGINGLVNVSGPGTTWLTVADWYATAESYTITSSSISRSGSAGIIYSGGVQSVTVDGGNDGNSFNVSSTSTSTSVTVNAGTGNDTVTVGNSTDGLGDLNWESLVTVNGVAGHTTLVLNDQAGTWGYLLVSDTYANQGFRTIDYANISNLVVDAQSAGSYEVDVVYTPASMMTTVNAGAGGDLIHLGGTFSGISGEVLGPVTINGAGNTQVIAYDQRDATAQTYTVTATTFTDSGFSLTYSNLDSLTINGGFASNVYAIQSTAAGMGLTINAGAAGDLVQLGGTVTGIAGNVLGPVTINGAGNTQVIAYAQTDTTAQTYTVTATTFADKGFALTYGNLDSLTIDGGSAYDVYDIESTAAGTAVTINGGNGRNAYILGSGTSLNSLQGAVSVNGGTAADGLIANNSSSASGQGYTLSATQLAGSDFATITYASLAQIDVTASGNDTLTLLTPVPTIATSFNGGSGTNILQGPNANNSWTISGANSGRLDNVYFSNEQQLIGGNANDDFYFTTSTASEASINGGAVGTLKRLDYSSLSSSFPVTVNLATNSAPLLSSGFSNINSVRGTADPANTLIAANTTNQWTISSADFGSVNTVGFIAMDHLVGGTGVDTFQFYATGTVLSVNGGGAPAQQGDWLDYSLFPSTSTVSVNLTTGSATNVNSGAAGAVTNIQNVHGSASGTNNLTGDAQGNILVGGSGANTLVGGSGASLLIGGSGHGTIAGGSSSDILIAGTVAANDAALMAILAELESADTFPQKVSDLMNGNNSGGGSDLNGGNKLTWGGSSPTVQASTGAFTLSGKTAALDWFFANAASTIQGFGVQDEHNNNAIGVF